MPKKREYFVGDIEIVALSPIYTDLVSKFECQIKDLNDFINDDALQQHEESINFTYLWISKKSKELLGYITICCDSIHLSGKKKEEMKKIGISYRALPALKICRMAVSKDVVRQGIGTKMIAFAIMVVLKINKRAGCRFLTLEAKNAPELLEYEKPIHFYKKNGFEVLKKRKENSAYISMYKDLKPIISQLKTTKFRVKNGF